MDTKRFMVAIWIVFMSLLSEAGGSEPATVIYSVCLLKALGPDLNGHQVRLRAQFMTDLNHRALFLDPSCPYTAIYEDEPRLSVKTRSILNFDHALWYRAPFLSLKFEVDVSGKFEWERNWQPPLDLSAVAKPQTRGVLLIERVWSFRRLPEANKNDHGIR